MYEIFEQLLKKHGVTAYRVAKETGVTTATLTNWKNGKYTPKQDKLQKIADYFGVSLEYLMTGKEKETNAPSAVQLFSGVSTFKREMEDLFVDSDLGLLISVYNYVPRDLKRKLVSYAIQIKALHNAEKDLMAAHKRTDIETTDEMEQHDNDIINDPDF